MYFNTFTLTFKSLYSDIPSLLYTEMLLRRNLVRYNQIALKYILIPTLLPPPDRSKNRRPLGMKPQKYGGGGHGRCVSTLPLPGVRVKSTTTYPSALTFYTLIALPISDVRRRYFTHQNRIQDEIRPDETARKV